MIDEKTYWAACDFDTIIWTDNYGISWAEQKSAGGNNSYLLDIAVLDERNALIAGESFGYPQYGKIIRTNNGGEKWEVVYSATDCEIPLTGVTIAKEYY